MKKRLNALKRSRCDRGRAGGGGGIRTHGAVRTRAFQARPLGLYGTPPGMAPEATRNRATSEKKPGQQRVARACRSGFVSLWLFSAAHWRKRWDSNPRSPCELTAFRERLLQPLGHSSAAQYSTLRRATQSKNRGQRWEAACGRDIIPLARACPGRRRGAGGNHLWCRARRRNRCHGGRLDRDEAPWAAARRRRAAAARRRCSDDHPCRRRRASAR